MSGVTITAAMRANLQSLQSTAALLGQTQTRLATGNRVNSALDDPSAFFAAKALSNRASDLSSLLAGESQSIQAITSAAQGIEGLTSLVNQAKSIAETAKSQVTSSAVKLGSVSINTAGQANLTDANGNATVANGDKFSIQLGATGPVTTITITTGETLATLASTISSIAGVTATTVAGATAGTLKLQITSTTGDSLIIADVTNTPGATILGSVGTTIATTQPPTDQVALEAQFNEIRTQIDQFVNDTGYGGTNLLKGDTLKTQFNEDNSSNQSLSGKKIDSAGLSFVAANFGTSGSIDTALTNVTSALATLRSEGQRYGNASAVIQSRQNFTRNLVATLESGASQLTIADKNVEGANLLALQTSQQLGIQALSLSSQSNQSVLRLFR